MVRHLQDDFKQSAGVHDCGSWKDGAHSGDVVQAPEDWHLHMVTPVKDSVRGPGVGLLAGMAITSSLTHGTFTPALVASALALGTSVPVIQYTLAAFLFMSALGQPVYGLVSDRIGRRPPLLFGLTLFLIGTLVCGVAPDAETMFLGRVLQGFGACAGVVMSRAIGRDWFGPERSPAAFAIISAATALGSLLGPPIGGLLVDFVHWRSIFVLLLLHGAVVLVMTWITVPETHRPTGPALPVWAAYRRLLTARFYIGLVIASALFNGTFFGIVTESPFVMTALLGKTPTEFGFYFMVMPIIYSTSSLLAARLAKRFNPVWLVAAGGGVGVLAVGSFSLLALPAWLSVPSFELSLALVALANGLLFSTCVALAIGYDPRIVGAAAGLLGTIHMTMNALGSLAAGLLHDGTIMAIIWIVAVPMLIAPLVAWWAFRGRPLNPA